MLQSALSWASSLGHKLSGVTTVSSSGQKAKVERSAVLSSNKVYCVYPFKDNELGVSHRHGFLMSFVHVKDEISFFVHGNSGKTRIYVVVSTGICDYFKHMFFSAYGTADLQEIASLPDSPKIWHFLRIEKGAEVASKDFFVQDGSYIDPMKDLFSLFSGVPKNSTLTLRFGYRFFDKKTWWQKIIAFLGKLLPQKDKQKKEDIKSSISGDDDVVKSYQQTTKEVYLSLGYGLMNVHEQSAATVHNNVKKSFGAFLQKGGISTKPGREVFNAMSRSQAVNFFHMPTKANLMKSLVYAVYRKLPPPGNVGNLENGDKRDLTILAKTDYKDENVAFGMKSEDKMRHLYIVGKTGTGKSTFLSNMIRSDMIGGKGLCLIDPHGDLVDTVLEHVPSYRVNDVVLFDIGDQEYPLGFNLLQYKTQDEKLRIVSGVVAVFHKMFGYSWGPRLEYILRNVLLTLVEYPNATIMHIMRLLTDKAFREEVLSYVVDQVLLKFWRGEFDKWQEKQVQDAIGPITNKVGQFLSSRIVRNIFGQPHTKLSMREAMDTGKIILVNLSKGRIGEDNARMVGSMLVTKIQIDAMSRADISFRDRRDFMLYIDEFQNFATDSFAEILSEARKYRLSLIVANQYTAQLDEAVRNAIFGNVGSIIAFTLGRDDGEMMSKQFKDMVSPNDMISIPKFKAYVKLMIDGVMSDPFSMQTFPLPSPVGSLELTDKIRQQSRQRYAMERNKLEDLLDAWSKKTFSPQEVVAQKALLEGVGLTEEQIITYSHPAIVPRLRLFHDYSIGNEEPDEIVFDVKEGDHKAVWYEAPTSLSEVAGLDAARMKGSEYKKNARKIYSVWVSMFEHENLCSEDGDKLDIRIGSPFEIEQQMSDGFDNHNKWKRLPNVMKRKRSQGGDSSDDSSVFSVKDIVLGERYEGYVKLVYNYGIFVTVKGVEGLLHKNYIVVEADVDFEDFYNIGDKIRVLALDFKYIKGEKKLVWSQKKQKNKEPLKLKKEASPVSVSSSATVKNNKKIDLPDNSIPKGTNGAL